MSRLMISISGVRGVYGDGLDDELAEKFAYAFGTLYGGLVVVGRDSRISGPAISQAVLSGLRKAGSGVIDIGLTSTPTTEMAVTARNGSGGVVITASHNPREWNGLKFLGPDGVFLDSAQGAELLEKYNGTESIGDKPLLGEMTLWDGANEHHIQSVLNLGFIDSETIASQHYTVCIDTVNGAGGEICTELLERLGCTVHAINREPTGEFAHNPEPVPGHIRELCAFVKEKGADIGFAVDPDVDRLSIVSEEGIAIGEEYTLAFAVDYIMGKTGTNAACNLSTSRMLDDAAGRHDRKVYRSPIGEINVVQLMRDVGADIGGEGNGGVILPALHYGRDAVSGMALILQLMTEQDRKISELTEAFPAYSIIKDKITVAQRGSWIEPVKAAFEGETMDERDGIKVIFSDSWVHIRESNTEPVVRIMAEAPEEDTAKSLMQKVRSVLIIS